jgi:hypothetical protein
MAAVRIDTAIQIDELGDFGGQGDVQVFRLTNKKGVNVTVFNAYDQTLQENNVRDSTRRARNANWKEILAARNVVVCGDINAHSPMWNDRCGQR